MKRYLVVVLKSLGGTLLGRWKFPDTAAFCKSVGRTGDLCVPAHYIEVSRTHLKLSFCVGSSFMVEMLSTRNGTYFDGRKLVMPCPPMRVRGKLVLFLGHPLHSPSLTLRTGRIIHAIRSTINDEDMSILLLIVCCLQRVGYHLPNEMHERICYMYTVFDEFYAN
jgi:hypothetical protein